MQKIFKSKNEEIVKFTEDDYFSHPEEILNMYGAILESCELYNDDFNKEKANENLNKILIDFFINEGASIYILFKNEVPVSAVVYSSVNDHAHLEVVTTNANYRAMGYAKKLTLASFKDLASKDILDVSLVVNDDNYPSNYLQESLSKVNGIKTFTRHQQHLTEYTFDISELTNLELPIN